MFNQENLKEAIFHLISDEYEILPNTSPFTYFKRWPTLALASHHFRFDKKKGGGGGGLGHGPF